MSPGRRHLLGNAWGVTMVALFAVRLLVRGSPGRLCQPLDVLEHGKQAPAPWFDLWR